jgi:ABC-type transporter Mla MlaB component
VNSQNSKRPVRRTTRAAPAARPTPRAKAAPVAVPAVGSAAAATPAPASSGPALPAALDIREIKDTFESLRSAVNCGVDSIDASRVTTVDTAGLQLLLAAGRTAAAHGRALRWDRPSSSLIDAATRLGVAGVLGLVGPG